MPGEKSFREALFTSTAVKALKMRFFIATTAWLGIAVLSARAGELPSADDVLKRMSQPLSQEELAESSEPTSGGAKLKADLEEFAKKSAEMPAEESAAVWLELFDRQGNLADAANSARHAEVRIVEGAVKMDPREVLLAVPGPDHWTALAKAIAARPNADSAREMGLRLLAADLMNDQAEAERLRGELRKRAPEEANPFLNRRIRGSVAAEEGLAAKDPLEQFETTLERSPNDHETLPVPELEKLGGTQRAEDLLVKALTKTSWSLEPLAEDSRQMIRQLAQKYIDELRSPQWRLVDSPQAAELYEAMNEKFPAKKADGGGFFGRLFGQPRRPDHEEVDVNRMRAMANYLAALIAEGREEDAAATAKQLTPSREYSLGDELITSLRKTDNPQQAFEMLGRLLAEDSSLPLWRPYLELAADVKAADEALQRAEAATSREGLDSQERATLQAEVAKALLASGNADQASAMLQAQLKGPVQTQGTIESMLQLGEISEILGKPELLGVAIDSVKGRIGSPRPEQQWTENTNVTKLASLMVRADRANEAIDLLVDNVRRVLHQSSEDAGYVNEYEMRPLLIELVSVYQRSGRNEDALKLLSEAPYWNAADISELRLDTDSGNRPIAFLVARALAETGQVEQAGKIIEQLIDQQPGYDPAYALLVQHSPSPEAAIATLDALFAEDPFQERPLIWKADLLQRGGHFDEAETTIRKAISIDPSDGEQPRGDRMRAYAVLAEILKAKGNTKEAELYTNVIRAIRMAEHADLLHAAGLVRRGVEMYKQSLELFQDAYCIQSRLAVQLVELGDIKGAEPHYRKAYELMPDSFGRVESHCFGCEGAFRGEVAQRIAEEIFTRFVQLNPDKPQAHYLLAYLRQQQNRYAESVGPLRTAVQLDPDYLNAWEMINRLPDGIADVDADRQAAVLNIIRLDPRQRHVSVELTRVRDLRALWNAVAAIRDRVKGKYDEKASVYPLKAAAAGRRGQTADDFSMRSVYMAASSEALRSPAHALLQTATFQLLVETMGGDEGGVF